MTANPPDLSSSNKFSDGNHPTELQLVPAQTVLELVRYFRNLPQSKEEAKRVVTFLTELTAGQRWLVCKCNGDFDKGAPVLYAQLVPNGVERPVVLVPLYRRGRHSDTCELGKEPPESSPSPPMQRREVPAALGVLSGISDPMMREAKTERQSKRLLTLTSETRLPTIAGVLFKLLSRANLNLITAAKRSVSQDKEALKKYLAESGESLDKGGKYLAKDYVKLGFYDFEKLATKLNVEKGWPEGLHPHGFVIERIREIAKEKDGERWLVPLHGERRQVNGRLYIPGAGTRGPWLAICLVTKLPGDAEPAILRAYLHPLESEDDFTLVDSGLERNTLAILREKLWLEKKRGTPYEITKPLIDMASGASANDTKVRPDFMVRCGTRVLVVETMGYNDDCYRERKERTHASMRSLEDVEDLLEHEVGFDKSFRDRFLDFLEPKPKKDP